MCNAGEMGVNLIRKNVVEFRTKIEKNSVGRFTMVILSEKDRCDTILGILKEMKNTNKT